MSDDYLAHDGPSTLWVMARADAAVDTRARRDDHVATPLPVVITAAGLVSAVRRNPDAPRHQAPDVAQWEAIRSHYRDVAEWIDDDTGADHPAGMSADRGLAGRKGRADMVDYLISLDTGADDSVRLGDVGWWLSGRPDYWVTAGESVDAVSNSLAEFRRDYEHASTIGPLKIYRRRADPPHA
ncbi:hypothetical protein A5636_04860 [Mycobacterium asiaticum]|uniref:Uncharacterized protein n=2 Tax=Mycobacterium asiaticum TaxID=1790 RepID=A0A1A3N3Y7_MYCAS|nr:hypothetical protein A5636_04860 [Mycobacterium asiaticum]